MKHGRHPHHRLTALTVANETRPGRYCDGNNLYLVVDPSGAKRWLWRGVIHGKRRDVGFGGLHRVTLKQARTKALEFCLKARDHQDPLAERRQQQRVVPTFSAAARAVHAEHSPTFRTAVYRARWIRELETYAFPTIGDRPVDTITSADVFAVLAPIWTRIPDPANGVKQRMKLIFDWAKAKQYRSGDNPTEGITKVLAKRTRKRVHHTALRYQDVPAFVAALGTLRDSWGRPTRKRSTASLRRALELLILTATRTSEVRFATWTEINFETATWTIPAERMKAGRVHHIPLCSRAMELLEEAYTTRGDSPWICPGLNPNKPFSSSILLAAARRLTTTPLTAHGFRSSFRDWAAERTNVARDVVEAALAHALEDKTEAAYKRTDLFEKRRELMLLWSQFVTATPGKVIAIGA
jgi:integrase